MNISITNACNRRCAYCFQKDWYLSKKAGNRDDETLIEMPVEEFAALCDWTHFSVIKIMGGEPLLHSKLDEILKTAAQKEKRITLISNISSEREQFDELYPVLTDEKSPVEGILVNTDYPASQEQVFLENFEKLCHSKLHLTLSTTLLPETGKIAQSAARLKKIIKIFCETRPDVSPGIRLAPFCPSPATKEPLKRYDFTQDVMAFFNTLYMESVRVFNFDCPVNLCEMDYGLVDACRELGYVIKTGPCNPEQGMPFDVLVDHSVIWCSSSPFLRLDDWRQYSSHAEAIKALSQKYYDWWRTNKVCRECKTCEYLNPGYCNGLCVAKNRIALVNGVIPIHSKGRTA